MDLAPFGNKLFISTWICQKKMFLDNDFNYCYYRFELQKVALAIRNIHLT